MQYSSPPNDSQSGIVYHRGNIGSAMELNPVSVCLLSGSTDQASLHSAIAPKECIILRFRHESFREIKDKVFHINWVTVFSVRRKR